MKKFLHEFKEFAMRGNVFDMAVGVFIGGAFGKITTSLVNDVFMPFLSLITGSLDFSQWKLVLKAADEAAGIAEVSLNYGNFIATVIDFLLIALVVFLMVKGMNALHRRKRKEDEATAPEAPPAPTTEELLTEIRDLLKEQK